MKALVLILSALLVAAGCGDNEDSPASPAALSIATPPSFQVKSTVLAGLGKLAVVASVNGQTDVYVVGSDGRASNVTRDAATEFDVSWSPDGERVAFSSDREGSQDVFVADADGSDVRRLTDLPTLEGGATWSPDGKRIAFALESADESTFAIYVLGVNGGEAKKLTEKKGCYVGHPNWSPNGEHLTVEIDCAGGGEIDVFRIDADGSNLRRLTDAPGDDGGAEWSPSGDRIAFASDRGPAVYTMNKDGGDERRVSPELGSESVAVTWSGDGARLVSVPRAGGDISVRTLGEGSDNPVPLTTGLLVTAVAVTDE